MPDLTPYDTGARLEPHRWRERPDQPDDYGKVDFDDDESTTVATLHIESTPDGRLRVVLDTDYEVEVYVPQYEKTVRIPGEWD